MNETDTPFPFCAKCGHQVWLGNLQFDGEAYFGGLPGEITFEEVPPADPPADPLAQYQAQMHGQPGEDA